MITILIGVVVAWVISYLTDNYLLISWVLPFGIILISHYIGRYEGLRKTTFKQRRKGNSKGR